MTKFSLMKQRLIEDSSLRWSSSFAFVIVIYACAILTAVYWEFNRPHSLAPPMAAMMIDLAPMPVAPDTPANAIDPSPVLEEIPEPEPEIEPEIEPLPELPVINEAEAVLPPEPEPEPIEEQPEPIEKQMEQLDSAPPSFEAQPSEVAAAPIEGAVSLAESDAKATWQSVLLGHLQRHKRYPREARRNRHEAVVTVRITINRDGTVMDYRLEHPSDYKSLNQETLALIARAQPLPPPPPQISGETVEFVVPVEFFLRR